MQRLTPSRIDFPVSFSDEPVVMWCATREHVEARLGPYHVALSPEESLTEPGPCVYWLIEYHCGLQIVVTSYDYTEIATACSNRLEPCHIARHLNLQMPIRWYRTMPQAIGEAMGREGEPNLKPTWRVVRQDDNGCQTDICELNEKGDAECRVWEFDALGHKQVYWVEAINKADAQHPLAPDRAHE